MRRRNLGTQAPRFPESATTTSAKLSVASLDDQLLASLGAQQAVVQRPSELKARRSKVPRLVG